MAKLTIKFFIQLESLQLWVARKQKIRKEIRLSGEESVLNAFQMYVEAGPVQPEAANSMLQIAPWKPLDDTTPRALDVHATGDGEEFDALCRHLSKLTRI